MTCTASANSQWRAVGVEEVDKREDERKGVEYERKKVDESVEYGEATPQCKHVERTSPLHFDWADDAESLPINSPPTKTYGPHDYSSLQSNQPALFHSLQRRTDSTALSTVIQALNIEKPHQYNCLSPALQYLHVATHLASPLENQS
jgi:hypothetical protein